MTPQGVPDEARRCPRCKVLVGPAIAILPAGAVALRFVCACGSVWQWPGSGETLRDKAARFGIEVVTMPERYRDPLPDEAQAVDLAEAGRFLADVKWWEGRIAEGLADFRAKAWSAGRSAVLLALCSKWPHGDHVPQGAPGGSTATVPCPAEAVARATEHASHAE